MPLAVMATSKKPTFIHMTSPAMKPPAAAAIIVVTPTRMTALSAASSEPALKPNQPNHRTKTPITVKAMLWPGIARGLPSSPYLPIRGPRK